MTTIARPQGTTLGVLRRLTRDPLASLTEIHNECGDLWILELPFVPTVFLSNPEDIHTVLVRDPKRYRKDYSSRQLSRVIGEGLLLAEGEVWRRHRRLAQPAFHADAIRGYGATMAQMASRAVMRWGSRQRIDLHEEMTRLTLDIVASTLFGHDLGDDASVIADALDTFMSTYRGLGNTGILLPQWVPTPQHHRHNEALARVDAIVYRMIKLHRDNPDPHTLLGMLLAATDESGGLTDRQLRDEAVTLLMAGHETTAIALTMALYLVSQHPNVEARLQSEIDSVFASLPGEREALNTDDFERLPYCRAVILETLRLYPPAWAIGREPVADVVLGGHRIGPGTHLWLAPWLTHRDARWFTDPLTFCPERWEGGALHKSLPDGVFFPFGAGSRVCIGKRFAELEAVLVLATILRASALRLAPGEDLRLMPSITLRPERGLSMIATRRDPQRNAA